MTVEQMIQNYKSLSGKRFSKEDLDYLNKLNTLAATYYEGMRSDIGYIHSLSDQEITALYTEVTSDKFKADKNNKNGLSFYYNDIKLSDTSPNENNQLTLQENNNPYLPLVSFLCDTKFEVENKKRVLESTKDYTVYEVDKPEEIMDNIRF